MRKILFSVMIAFMAVSFTACGSSEVKDKKIYAKVYEQFGGSGYAEYSIGTGSRSSASCDTYCLQKQLLSRMILSKQPEQERRKI